MRIAWGVFRKNQELFREVFQHAPFGLSVTGPDLRFVRVNPELCKILGYTEAEILKVRWPSLLHPEDREFLVARKERLERQNGGYLEGEARCIHSSGETVWVRLRTCISKDRHGNPAYYVSHVEDITERKRAEQMLQESEDRFRNIADTCPAMMWVTDAAGEV